MSILVTGGAGFIGAHTVVELINAGFEIVIVNNLVNSSREVIQKLEQLTRKAIAFYQIDIGNKAALMQVLREHRIEAYMHFAALKALEESATKPLLYYQNNVSSSITLFETLQDFNVHKIVFSSSACVYGAPQQIPVTEAAPQNPINIYGSTKVMVETILQNLVKYPNWSVINLRYFNPVGAHASGLIGENPQGTPNNLVPLICQAAAKKLKVLKIYGNDYDTPDGTGIRDYIHVVDLACAHVAALKKVLSTPGMHTYNLGTGQGYSVLEVIKTFEKVSNMTLPYEIVARRPGDAACYYADPSRALAELNWRAELSLEDMLRDAWLSH